MRASYAAPFRYYFPRLLLSLAACWLIYDRLFRNGMPEGFPLPILLPLLIAVILMPLNWITEAAKWKLQSGASLGQSLRIVLAGSASGFVTPGRSGEFLGRAMAQSQHATSKVLAWSIAGGLAQMGVTALAAAVGIVSSRFNLWWSVPLLLSAIGCFLVPTWPWLNRRFPSIKPETGARWAGLLLLSGIRYAIYLSQYVLVFKAFGIDHLPLPVLAGWIALLLMLYSVAPIMPLLDPAVRSGLALWLFAPVSVSPLSLAAATGSIWLLNVALPALTGLYFLWTSSVYESDFKAAQ